MPNLINSSQARILTEVLKNPGINLRGIIEKTSLSPNFISEYVNFLIKKKVLREEKLEKKRVYLRRFFINPIPLSSNIISIVKEQEKENFFKKYPKLEPILSQLAENIHRSDFVLVYGSYSRLAAEKDSDLDILIVGEIKNKEKIREILVSLYIEASIKIETLKVFKKRINDALHQQILKDNILIYDSGKFAGLLLSGRELMRL